jgi:hypothetical protein
LHDIISDTKNDEVKIRAISELHSIEMNLLNVWKQLPDLDIGEDTPQQHQRSCEVPPIEDSIEPWTWTLEDKPKPKPNPNEEKPIIAAPIVSAAPELTEKQERKDGDIDEEGGGWKLLKPTCSKSFYNNFTLTAHECVPGPII